MGAGILPARADITGVAVDTPGAVIVNKVDQLVAANEYAAYLASSPPIACTIQPYVYKTVPQKTVQPVGVITAKEIATASAQCLSPQVQGNNYNLTLVITFQWYDSAAGIYRNEFTASPCSLPSLGGQAVVPCFAFYALPPNAPTLNKWHRARFQITSPVCCPTFYSEVVPTLNGD